MKKPLQILLLLIINYSLLISNCSSQWVQQTLPISLSHPIKGLKFIDTLNGWSVSGIITMQDTSFILHTTNGGLNWNIQYTGIKQGFNALSMLNDSIGYAGGTDYINSPANTPLLLKTTNGGVNWNRLTVTSTTMFPNDLFFINKDSGWVSCLFSGPDVRTTTDGGLTWQVRTNGMNITTERLFFLNYNTGFCGAYFNFYKTTDAGMNWVQIGNFPNMIKSVYFLNVNTGWIGETNNKLYYTSNSGTGWILQSLPLITSVSIYDIYFINQNTGWAGIGDTYIYKTTNEGLNWGYQTVPSGPYRISILDSLRGWACGLGISKTTNGGGTLLAIQLINIEVPSSYKLYQNYPNPFNPVTSIKYQIIKSNFVVLKVYDILGREITTLINEKQNAGTYQIDFNPENLPSGIYFYRLITREYTETKKMILIK